MRILIVFFGLSVSLLMSIPILAEPEPDASSMREMTPEQLENFQFQGEAEGPAPIVEDLSIGQQFLLNTQRSEARDLIAQKLGIMSLKGDRRDLDVIQRVYDRRILRVDQVKEWQAMGVLFGDILAKEYRLKWVSYEDELGSSKALRYGETRNFVFPATVFSKRLQFGERLDIKAIYDKIAADVEDFIDYEKRLRPERLDT